MSTKATSLSLKVLESAAEHQSINSKGTYHFPPETEKFSQSNSLIFELNTTRTLFNKATLIPGLGLVNCVLAMTYIILWCSPGWACISGDNIHNKWTTHPNVALFLCQHSPEGHYCCCTKDRECYLCFCGSMYQEHMTKPRYLFFSKTALWQHLQHCFERRAVEMFPTMRRQWTKSTQWRPSKSGCTVNAGYQSRQVHKHVVQLSVQIPVKSQASQQSHQ